LKIVTIGRAGQGKLALKMAQPQTNCNRN